VVSEADLRRRRIGNEWDTEGKERVTHGGERGPSKNR